MKAIDLPKPKTVSYCGIDVVLREPTGFLATDNDGRLYWYSQEPTPILEKQFWIATSGASCMLGRVDLEGLDWRHTLQSIPKD